MLNYLSPIRDFLLSPETTDLCEAFDMGLVELHEKEDTVAEALCQSAIDAPFPARGTDRKLRSFVTA